MKRLCIGLSVLGCVAHAGLAHAYNNREHQRFPDQAVQMMNVLKRGEYLSRKVSALSGVSVAPLAQRPASVPASDQALWDRFIAEVKASPLALGQLRTGLSDPRTDSSKCGNAYPLAVSPIGSTPPRQHLAQCKASQLPFAVQRGWGTDTSSCFVRGNYFAGDSDAPAFYDELPTDFTGPLLGYYGQQVDDEVRDTVMWLRPTNILILSEIKAFAEDATDFGLAIALAPFACIFAFFSGDNCFDDARNASHAINPTVAVDAKAADFEKAIMSAIPGATDIDGDDWFSTTGLWHFINVEAGDGDFNAIGGMHYTHGGWRGGFQAPAGLGRIDAFDYAIIAGSDLIGLTLDPDEAQGVTRYQQSPDGPLSRRKGDWLLTIGHTEFEPLDNLALYGWRRFQRDHDASGLGWVLHALGDAVEPHHGIAATGWGHRPYEDYASIAWPELFAESGVNNYFVIQTVLERAFGWWRFIDDAQRNGNPDIPVRDLITSLAFNTRSGSDWAFHAGVSVGYGSGPDAARARELYDGDKASVLGLLENGVGATLAFLTKASQLESPDSTPSPCACPPGKALGVRDPNANANVVDASTCQSCTSIGQVEASGHCSVACPADQPLLDAQGHCTAACVVGPCTGVGCSNATDVVENGQCHAQCSAANPVLVGGHECRASCPPGMVNTQGTPSFCQSDPHCRATTGTRDAQGVCDEHCTASQPFILNSQCASACAAPQLFFVTETPPMSCLTHCPNGHQFSVPGNGPRECLASCPAATPYYDSAVNDCLAACPAALPVYIVGYTDCIASCPSGYVQNGSACILQDVPS